MTELTSQQIADRAIQAERLLKDPTLQKALEGVRQAILRKLGEVAIGDIDTQHELVHSLQATNALERMLRNWIADGQIEAAKAKQRQGLFSRVR